MSIIMIHEQVFAFYSIVFLKIWDLVDNMRLAVLNMVYLILVQFAPSFSWFHSPSSRVYWQKTSTWGRLHLDLSRRDWIVYIHFMRCQFVKFPFQGKLGNVLTKVIVRSILEVIEANPLAYCVMV
jgi:hypothetical protein